MTLDLALGAGELTARLVDFASVSGEEKPLADAIEAELRALPHLTVDRDGDTVVARTNLGRAERVVLAGHIDTVPHAGNFPSTLAVNEQGDRVLYGCGTSDMKSGVAVQLRLAATVPAPGRDVTYVFYDCEEVESERNGLGRVARTRPEWLAADFAVLLEPSGGVVEGGCQGTLRAEVTVSGTRSHSGRPWLGDNAVHRAVDVLARLNAYRARRPVVDGIEYREGLSAVGIAGGVAGNVVPDECVITVNYRFAPDRDLAMAEAHVREVFAGYPVRVTDGAPGARPGLDRPAAAAFVAAVGTEPRAKYGWTDVARFAEIGVPAVNFGPGDPNLAHRRDEHVEPARVVECENRMRQWLLG